jgi:hypothetical protein
MTPNVIATQLWQMMVNCSRQGRGFRGEQTVSS